MVGTGRGPGGGGNLFPGPALPFGMVQLSPDTESLGYGYHYDQDTIQGFSMTHMSGAGCKNEGDVFFTATTGDVLTQVSNFQSPYSHSQEAARPGYYRVLLTRWGIDAELSVTNRTGIAQFTIPAGKMANILLPISHTLTANHAAGGYIHVVGDRKIEGYVEDQTFCRRQRGTAARASFRMAEKLFPAASVLRLFSAPAGSTKEMPIFAVMVRDQNVGAPETSPYIQNVQLNGHAYRRNWVSFRDIVLPEYGACRWSTIFGKTGLTSSYARLAGSTLYIPIMLRTAAGGILHVALGSAPNRSWGAAAEDAPPSLSSPQP